MLLSGAARSYNIKSRDIDIPLEYPGFSAKLVKAQTILHNVVTPQNVAWK